MEHHTRIADATYPDDLSGLKLPNTKSYTVEEIYFFEAKNILHATLKYLAVQPDEHLAPFDYEWMQTLHREMFSEVWDWAGKLRHVELSIGVKAYLVPSELKKLSDDIRFWHEHDTFDTVEIAARLHHRAVSIHPFLNGNGRWARMLANIYLKRSGLKPIFWNDDALARVNPAREHYIALLKKADGGNYVPLVEWMRKKIQ